MRSRPLLGSCLLLAAVLATACGGSTPLAPTPTPTPASTAAVYVAGFEASGAYDPTFGEYAAVAMIWKNGVATKLTDGTRGAVAHSVALSGSDVYVAGSQADGAHAVAVVWKNGVATKLTDGTRDAHAYSIAVSPH